MSVKRRDLVQYLEANGFRLLREGANHSILYERSADDPGQAAQTARPDHGQRDLQAGGIGTQVLRSGVRVDFPAAPPSLEALAAHDLEA